MWSLARRRSGSVSSIACSKQVSTWLRMVDGVADVLRRDPCCIHRIEPEEFVSPPWATPSPSATMCSPASSRRCSKQTPNGGAPNSHSSSWRRADRRRDGGRAVGADSARAGEGLSPAEHQGCPHPAAGSDRQATRVAAGAFARGGRQDALAEVDRRALRGVSRGLRW